MPLGSEATTGGMGPERGTQEDPIMVRHLGAENAEL